ncbi:MAG: FAD-dependent oxidoreductase [Frankiaceae bacterium]
MPVSFTDLQRQVLTAFADTIVAAVPRDPDPDRFFARAASDLGVAVVAEQLLQATASDRQLAGLTELLDTLAGLGLHTQPLPRREVIVKTVAASGPEARLGVDALRQLCALLAYGAPDPATGVNPFWSTWSYPGPGSPAPEMPKPITPLVPAGDTTIGADVVVVGSGSGGGVVAAELARAGASVVVVEMGGYFNEADFSQYELWAYQNLYLRGGYFPTADGNVSLVAGSALGGGSLVNWSNCIQPPADIRRRWAREFGLAGVDSEGFDAHVDAVLQRISATTDCSDYNDPHRRLREGADKLGWHLRTAALNLAPDRYNPDLAGYAGYGDQTGAKQGTLNTFLQDAVDAGAQVLVRTRVQRVLVADGRAVGVTGTFADPATGATTLVTIRAPHVVLACGALETPALLLRSGIGGPAVGRNLKLHPAVGVAGIYAEPQASWWGPPQAAILDEFAGKDADGTGAYGYLIEGIQHSLGLIAATVPWNSAAESKELISKLGRTSFFVGLTQDRGAGTVTIDEAGNAEHRYPLDDELDRKHVYEALESMIRLHEAAGAQEVLIACPGLRLWHRGEDLDAFIADVRTRPLGFGGVPMFSGHQMGSARMGTDPVTSVAQPTGELHDVAGVWIGDTSAFPTCSGVNPMVSCMALARRTANFISEAVYSPTRSAHTHEVLGPAQVASVG